MSAVICDKGMAARVKKKVYNVVVRPAVACGTDKTTGARAGGGWLKMLTIKMLMTRRDKIRKKYIRRTAHVEMVWKCAEER